MPRRTLALSACGGTEEPDETPVTISLTRAPDSLDPALATMFRLQEILPRAAGLMPRELEYGLDTGVTVVPASGPRVRFGSDEDLDWQITALVAVRRELDRQGQRPELIDVRFKDRPYAR